MEISYWFPGIGQTDHDQCPTVGTGEEPASRQSGRTPGRHRAGAAFWQSPDVVAL